MSPGANRNNGDLKKIVLLFRFKVRAFILNLISLDGISSLHA